MHALSLIFILVALGFNESSSGFGCQIYPDSTANEFPVSLSAHGKQTQSDPQNDLSKPSNQWAKLWMAKDLNQVVELYADDGVFLTGNGDRITDKAAIRDLYLMVFRKQNDGKWLIVEHVWTDKPVNK